MTTKDLRQMAERLFPLARSITGPAIKQSAAIMSEIIPWTVSEIPSGEEIFDWQAPMEWELIRARLWDPEGNVVLDSNESNLHVVNFSIPFSGVVSREELEHHLFTRPDLPDAIPYVTSYYRERWGLCLTERKKASLGAGDYRVEIKTRVFPGALCFWTARLDAHTETEETILVSTYLCHPSLGNNELSGPLGMATVFEELSQRFRSVNYLFLLAPETIGSLAFLRKSNDQELSRLVGGVVLTCLGGPSTRLSLKLSRSDWIGSPTMLDQVCSDLADLDQANFEVRGFDPSEGSDERQFCSPGFNLPVVQAARTVYGQYEEYHTSLDDLEFMDIEAVQKSAESISEILRVFEVANCFPVSNNPKGEPFLSKRRLYPDINYVGGIGDTSTSLRMKLLSLSDGARTTREIWLMLGVSPVQVCDELQNLKTSGLIVFGRERRRA